ncbi:MAG: Flagellar basal-body rod protein FlgF [Labilithrix sp.]|nr:Flagellar basal-body rod protein FlgF [Labilithrix sp.]
MSRGIYVALSGAVAQEAALESTAANLANATTTGYQRVRPVFREVLAGATNKAGSALHQTVIDESAMDATRGALRMTGRSLDMALPEGIYLGVTTPRGERYTRGGALKVASDGSLQTSTGQNVAGEDGKPIKVDAAAETAIASDGSVTQDGEVVGRLRLVKLEKGTSMKREGANLLAADGGTPVATSGQLDVGALEESNATVVGSMTELVTASRTFEAFQRMLDTFGEIDRKVLTTTPTATEG